MEAPIEENPVDTAGYRAHRSVRGPAVVQTLNRFVSIIVSMLGQPPGVSTEAEEETAPHDSP